MKITSINNDKVQFWAKLKTKKYRDSENLFMIESENLVSEALKKGIVKEIITTKEDYSSSAPIYYVTDAIMKKLSNMVSPSFIMAVCQFMVPESIKGNVLVLDRIQDPGNLGTIIRSAVAFGFNSIIVSNDTVDIYNDKVIRSSEGMIFNINITRDDLENALINIKNDGYKVYGTDVVNGKSIKDFKAQKAAFVIGNEGKGMSDKVRSLCDDFIYINMSNKCESLNAAVASSIIMYEVYNG